MIENAVYVLDANVFIQAYRNYYPFDIALGFWEALVHHAQNGRIVSIDRVKAEIDRGNDQLKEWANEVFSPYFASTSSPECIDAYRQVIAWVESEEQFRRSAKDEFASGADGWVIAYAMAQGYVVVSTEKLNLEVQRRVPIPNVCHQFNVRCIDTFQMLRELKVRMSMAL